MSLRAGPGHITPGRRASLVDAVLDLPEVQESARVEAAFRLGDGESLHRLRQRCEDVSTRPAGWSALVDANLPSSRARHHVPAVLDEIELDRSYDQVAAVRARED